MWTSGENQMERDFCGSTSDWQGSEEIHRDALQPGLVAPPTKRGLRGGFFIILCFGDFDVLYQVQFPYQGKFQACWWGSWWKSDENGPTKRGLRWIVIILCFGDVDVWCYREQAQEVSKELGIVTSQPPVPMRFTKFWTNTNGYLFNNLNNTSSESQTLSQTQRLKLTLVVWWSPLNQVSSP